MAYGTWTIEGRDFVRMVCGECGVEFYFPEALDRRNHERGPEGGWHCPNGHRRIYSESDATKLRRERDQLVQRVAQKDDEIAEQRRYREVAERRVAAAKGQITKIKRRASNGVCPCCNRTFADLARHMSGKHPGWVKEPDAADAVTMN